MAEFIQKKVAPKLKVNLKLGDWMLLAAMILGSRSELNAVVNNLELFLKRESFMEIQAVKVLRL